MSDQADNQPQRGEVATEIAANTVNEFVKTLAALNHVDPMTAAAIGGFAGGVIKVLPSALTRAIAWRHRRQVIAAESAYEVAGGDLEGLMEKALADDAKLELLLSAFEKAQHAADLQRVRFYGRIAATGVLADDIATVDRAQRIFSSLAALDAVDLKVLLHMAKDVEREWVRTDPNGGPTLDSELPEVGVVLDAVLPRLEAHGLVTTNAGVTSFLSAPHRWQVTDYGQLCLRELANVPDLDAPPPTSTT
ncbi:hypothetical protein ACQPW3_11105 [Actinosynnema sp. CA-248983]